MRKDVYKNEDGGLIFPYHNGEFYEFMKKFEGAERITWDSKTANGGFIEYYHIIPHNVTIRWVIERNENGWNTLVTLFGDGKGISEVEKRISEEINKIRSIGAVTEQAKKSLEKITI